MSLRGLCSDHVVSNTKFRAWMDGETNCSIQVYVEHSGRWSLFRSHLVDESGNVIWKSGDKPTPQDALAYGQGMVRLYKSLAQRRLDQLADPSVQIAYGIEERKRQRKATHA